MSLHEIFQWIIGSVFGVLSVLYVILPFGGAQRLAGSITNTLPETPESFTPAVRFVVFTDSHNQNDHVADAVDTAYELFDNDPVYKGVDAFFGLGDFSSVGGEGDYANYARTLREHVRGDTVLVNIHGNHEFKEPHYKEYFVKHFGHEPDTVTEINGFSFIAFSGTRGATEWTFTPKSLKWLSDAINEAEDKATDGRAIFVFQHPHPWGTVYGSTYWGDPQLNVVLNGHHRVVDFSGHSHFPMNDPRSLIQTSYTSVGCGAMATFETDKNYLPGHHPDGYDPAAQMCVVEADTAGAVRILEYDLLSDTFFNEYYIADVNDAKNYAYTYRNMKAHDGKPRFAENTLVSARKNEGGEWVISFPEAEGGCIVHHYNVVIRDENGKKIYKNTFVDDYFVIDEDDTADFRIGSDTLEAGKTYTATLQAVSAYHNKSEKLTVSFTAE